jgi:cytidylate kinase
MTERVFIAGRPLLIAVDGTAASGKGTLAQKIAGHYGLDYLDTGGLYRGVGQALLAAGKDPGDREAAASAAKSLDPSAIDREALYGEGVGAAASVVSAYPEVRAALLACQRRVAESRKGAVLDGRDIGTVVCPDAHVKFYVTAGLEARAMRRFKQLQSKTCGLIYEDILADLRLRDERDSTRAVAPLVPAEDAVSIDTTFMEPVDVYNAALYYIRERLRGCA